MGDGAGGRRAPGREQLLEAALHLVAERGARAATVRAVAGRAGVTAGLVVHHFGTKAKLVDEVDRLVLERFAAAMAPAIDGATAEDAVRNIASRLSDTIGADAAFRAYVRRAILEATPAGALVLGQLVDLTVARLRELTDPRQLPRGAALRWLAVQIVVLNLAGTLLEPLLEALTGVPPFESAEIARRTDANRRFITTALAHLRRSRSTAEAKP